MRSVCMKITASSVFIISITVLIILSKLYASFISENLTLEELSKNFSSKGISEIFISTNDKCPAGSYPLLDFMFSGTSEICLCTNKKTNKYNVSKPIERKCNLSLKYSFYSCELKSLPDLAMNLYRGKKLCANPSEFNYDSYEYASSSTNCPSNSKVCGKDQTGFLCLNIASPCPVNYLSIVNSANGNSLNSVKRERKISLGNNYELIYSNEYTDAEIVSQTGWSFEGKCIKTYQNKLTNNNGTSIFKNNLNWVQQCSAVEGVEDDLRWREVDKYNLIDWLTENSSIFSNLEDSSTLSASSLNKPILIQKRGYLHFNKSCK